MTINTSAAVTAALLAGLILAGSLVQVHAEDGGRQDQQGPPTTTLRLPVPPAAA